MSNDELRRQILQFLSEFKQLMADGCYFVKNHQKNLETLQSIGLTVKQRDKIIQSLRLENYSSGPTDDLYQEGVYWVFGYKRDQEELYIKLCIKTSPKGIDQGVCWSFHIAEHPLIYPFNPPSK